MFETLVFQTVPGTSDRLPIRLVALSTCGFCRRGQEFLEKHGLAYEYIHLDLLDPEVKSKAKQDFKERFGVTLSYPTLVVGDNHTVGYVKRQWEDLLGLPHEDDLAEADSRE